MGPSGADRTQVGPMLASSTLLSGLLIRFFLNEKVVTYDLTHLPLDKTAPIAQTAFENNPVLI